MKKIEALTKKQEAKIPIYLKRYFDKVYDSKPINKKMVEDSVNFIYTHSNYKKPLIWYCESPLMAQLIANILTNKKMDNLRVNLWVNLWDNLRDNLRVNLWDNLWVNLGRNLGANLWANLWDNLRVNLWANLGDNLWANLGANLRVNLWDNLRDNLRVNLWDNLRDNLRVNLWDNLWVNLWDNLTYIRTSYYGNISDYGWTCFYEFINNELISSYRLELWDKWKQLIDSNVYDMIQLDGLCIVISMPSKILINNNKRLHSTDNPAVEFKDGYKVYAWNGIIIPENWIMNKKSITKEDIIKETNAEKRRCLMEIIGNKRFAELLDIKSINESIDLKGNIMKLYRTKEKDSIVNEYLYFYNGICPSTKREYFIPVRECNTALEAKRLTFNNQNIEIRHGDLGFLNLKKEFNQPIFES